VDACRRRSRKAPPLVVAAHGPSGVYTLSFPGSWGNYAHCYTGKGWAVFQPNFRGSSNYGDAFLRADHKDWGKGDFSDIMSGVDQLVAKGVADKTRMAFHGWSYGGYLTSWTIPNRPLQGRADGAGLTNMISMYAPTTCSGLENTSAACPGTTTRLRACRRCTTSNAKTPT
jgi:dipeptidyl aminopeptidase/acylaminoacyl peptidase